MEIGAFRPALSLEKKGGMVTPEWILSFHLTDESEPGVTERSQSRGEKHCVYVQRNENLERDMVGGSHGKPGHFF